MRRIDLLIGAVIVLSIVVSFVGVATYEAVKGDQDYTIVWASKTNDVSGQGGRSGNGAAEVNVQVNLRNITKVDLTARASAMGTRPNNVNIDVRVMPVNGTEETKRITIAQGAMNANGEVTFSITIGEAPNATQASGASENETLAQLAQEHTSQKGMGTWKVFFTVSNAGDPVPVVGAGGTSFTFNVSGKAHTYSATLQPLTPEVNR